MIKAFLFDYDGVITQGVPDGTLAHRLAKALDITKAKATEWIAGIWSPLLKGELTEDDVFKIFEDQYGQPISKERKDIWFKWEELVPLPSMTELVRGLKSEGYILGVLSNATAGTKAEIRKNGGYDLFDFVIVSSEVGCKKPDAEIFEVALKRLPGIHPNEVVFLDDRESATQVAEKLGFKVILVKDHAKAIQAIEVITKSH